MDKHLRAREMSVEQLSDRSDLCRAAIYSYLTDRNRPSSKAMARICTALGVPLSEGMKQFTPRKVGRPGGTRSITLRGARS